MKARTREVLIKLTIALLILLAMVLSVFIPVRGASWLTGYDKRFEINIDNTLIEDTLTHYPIPIFINGSAGQSNDDLTAVFDEIGSNNLKLAVTEDDGTTELYVEIEKWDDTGEDALIWVSGSGWSISSSADTTIYLYFDNDHADNTAYVGTLGNRTEVWDSSYLAVYHFADASGSLTDSTSNGNDGTASGDPTYLQTGDTGYSIDFDGTGDQFNIGDVDANHMSFDAVVKADSGVPANYPIVNKGITVGHFSPYYQYHFGINSTDTTRAWVTTNFETGHNYDASVDVADGTFKSLGFSYDGYTTRVYVQGTTDGYDTDPDGNIYSYGTDAIIAGYTNLDNYSDMVIDELRISNVKREIEYFKANNSARNDALLEFETMEQVEATSTPTATATSTPTPPAILMGDPSDSSVPDAISTAVATALANYRPDSELGLPNPDMANMWAVTHYGESSVEDYYWVSVAGMVVEDTGDLDGWDLGESLWNGLAVAEDNGDTTYTAHLYGSVGYENMLATAGLADISFPDTGGDGSYTYYLPFPPGRVAYYGNKGVHDAGHGYGGYGWRAVDFVGGAIYADNVFPNSVYVSQSGTVSYVCKDSIQTWVQIGNFLYGHLNDNETLEYEIYHSQGSYLGSLVTGSHDTNCGYMDQRDTSYHLHIGFLPDGNYFQWEDYTLNLNTECFYRGNEEICPNDYLLAGWSANIIDVPTPGPTVTPGGPTVTPGPGIPEPPGDGGGSGQIWDGFINSAKMLVQERVDMLNDPNYDPADMPNEVSVPIMFMDGVRIALRSIYVLAYSNVNLTITVIVFTLILVLETIRILRAVWMGIKAMVPFIG